MPEEMVDLEHTTHIRHWPMRQTRLVRIPAGHNAYAQVRARRFSSFSFLVDWVAVRNMRY